MDKYYPPAGEDDACTLRSFDGTSIPASKVHLRSHSPVLERILQSLTINETIIQVDTIKLSYDALTVKYLVDFTQANVYTVELPASDASGGHQIDKGGAKLIPIQHVRMYKAGMVDLEIPSLVALALRQFNEITAGKALTSGFMNIVLEVYRTGLPANNELRAATWELCAYHEVKPEDEIVLKSETRTLKELQDFMNDPLGEVLFPEQVDQELREKNRQIEILQQQLQQRAQLQRRQQRSFTARPTFKHEPIIKIEDD